MLLKEEQCRACSKCYHLNLWSAKTCEFGCGALTAPVEAIPLIARRESVIFCHSCSALFCSLATVCRRCGSRFQIGEEASEATENSASAKCHHCHVDLAPHAHFCHICGCMVGISFSFEDEPIIPIIFRHKGSFVQCGGLVDSGAKSNVFPMEIARFLDIPISPAETIPIVGVAAGAKLKGYKAEVDICIGFRYYKTVVYFCSNLSTVGRGFLGRGDLFRRFIVEFGENGNKVTLKENSAFLKEESASIYSLYFEQECS